MDTRNICLCCLKRPPDRDMKMPYTHLGKTEIYLDMLKECFEIHPTSNDESRICEVCVGCLRDAYNFKLQVLHSQAELQRHLHKEQIVKQEESSLKSEHSDNDEELIHFSEEVKLEISDPLPSDTETTFNNFEAMIDTTNLASDVGKLGPTEPTYEQPSYPKPTKEHSLSRRNRPKKCTTCGQNFANKALLVKHKQIHSTCTICKKQFKFKCLLKTHRLTVCHRNAYCCDLCNKQFERRSHLSRHKLVHLGEKPFSCDECDKRFTDVSYLNIHKIIHTKKTYTCDICQAKFLRKQVLIAHIGRHQGKKHFSCTLCSKRFWKSSDLYMHQKSHTDNAYYTCDECRKVYTNRQGLTDHLKTHLRKYSCNVCGKDFSYHNSLRRHKVVHTGERPYSCESCQMSFRHKHHLTSHRLTHTGEKPHCCETCGKRFSEKNNLRTHSLTHVKGNYPCELCTKSYSTKEGLRQHSRTHMKNNKSEAKLRNKAKRKRR